MPLETPTRFVAVTLPRKASRVARWTALALMIAVAGPHPVRASPEAPSSKVKRYPIRAEIVQMPDRPGGYVTLRHEAIDDFTDESGAVVGMNSMVMGFPVAREASLNGLAVGDKIEAVLEVDWDQGFMQLERIAKLPRETALHFGKARRPGSATARSESSNPEKQP
jgi:Cu/Ag efflux protein CusF